MRAASAPTISVVVITAGSHRAGKSTDAEGQEHFAALGGPVRLVDSDEVSLNTPPEDRSVLDHAREVGLE